MTTDGHGHEHELELEHDEGHERSSLDRILGAALPLLLGGVVLRLVITGTYRSYVKDSMWPWLALAGAGLLVLAGWELLARRAEGGGHRPAIAWLLLLPVVAVVGIAPGALGSAALERASRPSARLTPDGHWAALPRDGGPLEMTVGEFVDRSQAGPTTVGVPVTLTGFVAPDEDGTSRFRVVRFRISCCAADAAPVAVRIVADDDDGTGGADDATDGPVPPTDSWVTVTGTLVPDTPAALEPRLRVTSVERVAEPAAPYESVVR